MEVLPRGKAAIARQDRNDINDHLVLGEGELVKDRLSKARPVRKSTIKKGLIATPDAFKAADLPIKLCAASFLFSYRFSLCNL